MALFGRRKSETNDAQEQESGVTTDSGAAKNFQPDPDKARRWFDYAKAASDTYNYEYALTCYANGIKFDPEAMSAHEAIYETAVKYGGSGGKPASGKDIRTIDDGSPMAKFAAAEFAWMKDLTNGSLALKALEAAIKANQIEFGHWAATRVLGAVRRAKKPSKGTLIQAKDLFKEVGAWNEALIAGQLAIQLDPSDAQLDHELKDLSAQRAMDAGGYEQAAGKEGGFRQFIKDSDRQQELQEEESITAGKSAEERRLLRAKAAYEENPSSPDSINQYAQLLKKEGTPETDQLAYDVYMKGFESTGEYRFRMNAGDIKIEQLRRIYEGLQSKVEANASDEALKEQTAQARKELLELEAKEFTERVAKYPTDRHIKMRLGEIQFTRGNYEDSMAALQKAKDEPTLRVRAGHMLGRCFAAESWHREAISEFKEALAAIDATEKDRELAIRYDLMASLIEESRTEQSVELAREALDICSSIARKNITYRDIRNKRKEVDELIKSLSGGGKSG